MVGRTPEYLGKKIESYEMKMASIMILIPPILAVFGTAIAVVAPGGKANIFNPGIHGFSEVLYAFSSCSNNNGSAFAGLGANNIFYNTILGICMFFARYWIIIPVLALAGSLVSKKKVPAGVGTFEDARSGSGINDGGMGRIDDQIPHHHSGGQTGIQRPIGRRLRCDGTENILRRSSMQRERQRRDATEFDCCDHGREIAHDADRVGLRCAG